MCSLIPMKDDKTPAQINGNAVSIHADLPVASIITPVYNPPGELFQRCIESVLTQDEQRFEWILVDDGSLPETIDALIILSKKDSRVRISYQTHGGVSHARNIGLEMARGELVTFVDADDWIAPCFLSSADRLFREHNADIAYGLIEDVDGGQRNAPDNTGGSIVRTLDGPELVRYQRFLISSRPLKGSSYLGIRPSTVAPKVYRRSLLKQLRFASDMTFGEDSLFGAEAACLARRIVITDEVWYHYVKNVQSTSLDISCDYIDNTKKSMKSFVEHGKQNGWRTTDIGMRLITIIRNQFMTASHAIDRKEISQSLDSILDEFESVLSSVQVNQYDTSKKVRLLCLLIKHKRVRLLTFLLRVRVKQI